MIGHWVEEYPFPVANYRVAGQMGDAFTDLQALGVISREEEGGLVRLR
jgi:hypothetical protein